MLNIKKNPLQIAPVFLQKMQSFSEDHNLRKPINGQQRSSIR